MENRMLLFFISLCLTLTGAVGITSSSFAADAGAKRIELPKPATTGGKPLMVALAQRKSIRNVTSKPVSVQDLSNLLWAAWGISRPDGKRTIPTSSNRQEAAVYVALESGVWRYDAAGNALVQELPTDTRAKFGGAPLTLLYAARANEDSGGMHVGSIYQNVGLYCASVGLGSVVKSSGRNALDGSLNLPSGYKIYVVQSVGWPE